MIHDTTREGDMNPHTRSILLPAAILLAGLLTASAGCSKKSDPPSSVSDPPVDEYTIERTLSDGGQQNTIAFDGLAFLTGNVGSQSFLPPGKVADYSGFQYLRDNDPTQMGHNTSFVTIVALNVLNILDTAQIGLLTRSAKDQVALINAYAYKRFPLIQALRRHADGDLPAGTTGLDKSAVTSFSADLYAIDGQISYNRAKLMGSVLSSLSPSQRAALQSLGTLQGVGNWNAALPDPLGALHLDKDVNVAVMTYASEMYAWFAGSVESDVYFCPERQGTCFGSFYLKDWPAMGNPNYTINEQLTASAGSSFLAELTAPQRSLVAGLVDEQRAALNQIVTTRRAIATLLRAFQSGSTADSAAVIELSRQYGRLDGEIVYDYAVRFTEVARSLTSAQRDRLTAMAQALGYIAPTGAFLYSEPVPMPAIESTDNLFN